MRRVPAAAGLAVLLALVACAPPSEAKGASSLGSGVAAEGFAVVGPDVIYMRLEESWWELTQHGLGTGDQEVLATIPYGTGTRIRGLQADVDWVVWSDDRSGDFEIYALERASGLTTRVTQQAGVDKDVHLQGGRISWERSAQFLTATLPDGDTEALDAGGQSYHPVLLGSSFIFVRPEEGKQTSLVSRGPGREDVFLERAKGAFPKATRSDGNVLAWITTVQNDPDDPGKGFAGAVVQFSDGPVGPVRNLTEGPVEASSLVLQDGQVCWLEGERIRCHRWSDGTWLEASAHATAIAASATHYALFSASSNKDLGELFARPWADDDAGLFAPAAPWPLLVAGTLAAAAVLARRPPRGPESPF